MLTSCVCSAQIAHIDRLPEKAIRRTKDKHKFFTREHDTVLINFNRYFIGILCGVSDSFFFSHRPQESWSFFNWPKSAHVASHTWIKCGWKKLRISCKSFFDGAKQRKFIYRNLHLNEPRTATTHNSDTQNDWQSGKWRTSGGPHINELLCTWTNSRSETRQHQRAKINQCRTIRCAIINFRLSFGLCWEIRSISH